MSDARARRALYENLAAGKVEIVGTTPEGDELWRLNEEGKAHARALIDEYIDHYDDPAAVLAASMEVPLEIAEGIVAHRLNERAAGAGTPGGETT